MAREPGYAKYPAQITYSDTAEEAALIAKEAEEKGISKADVVRELVSIARQWRLANASTPRHPALFGAGHPLSQEQKDAILP